MRKADRLTISPEKIPEKTPGYNLAVCVLASGSKGNAIYISAGTVAVLIDAGLSGIEITRRLQSKGLSPDDLDAIIVSHEHSDHIQSVGVLSRRHNLPVYMNTRTRQAAAAQLGDISQSINFECGTPFKIKTLTIHPFSLSHDAKDPVGFAVSQNGSKVGIATDLGIATAMVKEHLKQCNLLILEANHDPVMLIEGPYPWPLKQRIKSRSGHLSNEASRNLLEEVKHESLECVILAHISETNNTSQKALHTMASAIDPCHTKLAAARQDVCGEIFYLK